MMITHLKLKELLFYNEYTGLFTRLIKTTNNVKVGETVGFLDRDGYVVINLANKQYKAHRLAWFYMTGEWPENQLDHIDTIGCHNWFSNLRKATNAQNCQNKRTAVSKTGYLGVCFDKGRGYFYSRIVLKGKTHHLGSFNTPELAHNAYVNAKRKLHEFGTL